MADIATAALEGTTMRKVFWRIIPYTFFLYVISYLDRANIGYAALQMNKELALTSEAFGFAAGIFFIGYFLFEVPRHVALNTYGSRVWISRILITWGLVATATAFAQTAHQLYILRFLLSVAEAGFFLGVIIYLTDWFRSKEQATMVALFTAAIPVSYLLGGPLSTWIMDNVSGLGPTGWRWMLILEGGPAIVFGVLNHFIMTDRPEQARWLRAEEREWLVGDLDRGDQLDQQSRRFRWTLRYRLPQGLDRQCPGRPPASQRPPAPVVLHDVVCPHVERAARPFRSRRGPCLTRAM